jgi:MSHA biogenesis protein MshQ
MLFRSTFVFFLLIFSSYSIHAAECLDIFPTLSQNYGSQLTLPNFKYSSTNDGDRNGGNLALSSGQYGNVNVSSNGIVFFTELNAESRLKRLILNDSATALFVAGDYWIEDFEFGKNTTLAVVGAGTVRIYVNDATLKKNVHINDANGSLIFISYGDISVKSNLNFTGIMYAKGNIKLKQGAVLLGSVTAGNVTLGRTISENYQVGSITNADFNGMCNNGVLSSVLPIAEYRFDECHYTGSGFNVVDQIGNFPAKSYSNLDTSSDAQIERAANIFNENHHIETSIPINGNFSVSTWFKKPSVNSGSRYLVLGSMANSGGDLLYLDRNNNYRWGVYDGNSFTEGNFWFGNLTSGWHHLALIYSSNSTTLYIDGDNKGTVGRRPSGTIKYIGTSFDEINSSNPQGFRAPLDEFTVFDTALTSLQIQEIYNNQLNKNNYDGTPRTAVQCSPVLVAHYSMNEASWGAVLDSVNGFHGSAFNGADTVGSSCRYGKFDGIDDYVQIPHSNTLNGSDSLTYMAFVRADSWTGVDQIMAKSVHGGGSGRAQMGMFSENGVFKGRAETVNGRIEINTTLPLVAGDWIHLALVFNGSSLKLYQNGIERATTSFSATTLVQTTDPLNISKRVGTSQYYFHGLMDDVRVYSSALSTQEINDVINTITLCSLNGIDHYQVVHDGSGLTCAAETITIKACTNSYDGSCTLSNEAVTIDVKATGTSVVTNRVSFTGSGTASIPYTTAETVVLSLENPSITATNADVCNDNSAGSCNLLFADAGFRFLYGAGSSEVIANQEADGNFNDTLKIQAVENNNGVCIGIFTGNVAVNLAQENISPSGSLGASFQISASDNIAKYPNFSNNITLNFGANSIATIPTPKYLDAGQIKLHASYSNENISLLGASKNFWVKPDHFVITAKSVGAAINGFNAESPTIHKAGKPFNLIVTAQNSDNNTTQNYQQGQIELKLTRFLPSLLDSAEGELVYASNKALFSAAAPSFVEVALTNFTAGQSVFSNAKYSEVGIIKLDVRDANYAGQGLNVESEELIIGRFIPDHFKQTVVSNGQLMSTCNVGNTDFFAYNGQKSEVTPNEGTISYLANPVVEITAYSADNSITQNYYQDSDGSSNDFMKLTNSGIKVTIPGVDNVSKGLDLNFLPMQGIIYNGEISQKNLNSADVDVGEPLGKGILHYRLSSNDHFNYIRSSNALVGNFPANFDLSLDSITDNEVSATTLNDIQFLSGVDIRFGRWKVENSSGPETSNLPQPMYAQYFNEQNKFVTNTDDNCSVISSENNEVTQIGGSLNSSLFIVTQQSGYLQSGYSQLIELEAPNVQGDFNIKYAVPSWLQYDWNNTGNYLQNPTAVATFGVFRGNDRIISWREIVN